MAQNQVVRTAPFDQLRVVPTWVDRLFPWSGDTATETPSRLENLPLDVYDKNGDLVVRAALPGVKQEDVKISITDDLLQIAAERKDEKEIRKADYYVKEYSAGSWFRSVRLPADVLADQATATYANGFVTLTIPRNPTSKPRSVEVKLGRVDS